MSALWAAQLLGGGSLLLFGLHLWLGSLQITDFQFSSMQALAFNLGLSFVFFFQHSLTVRRSFLRILSMGVPKVFHGALYSITSGAVLLCVVIFWQPTSPTLVAIGAPLRWLLRAVFVGAVALFYWGLQSIGGFDGFGTRKLSALLKSRRQKQQALTIRGAYRWVRHPLYTGVLMMIWSCPDVGADRVLFNISWTLWIVLATRWEERDLVTDFGQPYRTYQEQVPMLAPWRIPAGRTT